MEQNLDLIISSSLDTLKEKKSYVADMNSNFKEAGKHSEVDPVVLRRVKDYTYYKGNGWNTNPLDLDKEEKYKDRVSPTFRKLVTIIDDLAQTEHLELLNEYVDYLKSIGITIDFSKYIPLSKTKDKQVTDQAIDAGVNLQGSICELADRIKDEDSCLAEVQGFGPHKEYTKLINLAYMKNTKGKDIEDKCQEKCTDLSMSIESYQIIQHKEF